MPAPPVPLDPLTHVLHRVRRVLGAGTPAEDTALAVVARFLADGEPGWLRDQPAAVRLDVLTVQGVLAHRRTG